MHIFEVSKLFQVEIELYGLTPVRGFLLRKITATFRFTSSRDCRYESRFVEGEIDKR
jgi:hypothetical protein